MEDYLALLQKCCEKYYPDCRKCPLWLKDTELNTQFGLECDGGVYNKTKELFKIDGIKDVLDAEFNP